MGLRSRIKDLLPHRRPKSRTAHHRLDLLPTAGSTSSTVGLTSSPAPTPRASPTPDLPSNELPAAKPKTTEALSDVAITTRTSSSAPAALSTPEPSSTSVSESTTGPGLTEEHCASETLWQQAIAKIKPEYQEHVEFQNKSELEVLNEFIQTVAEKQKDWQDNQWYYERGGEKVYLRDHMNTLLVHLNRYAIIGDIAVGCKPDVAALAWAGFRFLLKVASADMENMKTIFESLAYLVRLVIRCSLYENIYIQRHPNLAALKLLNHSLLNLYVSALEYLHYAMRHLNRSTAVRITASVWSGLGECFQNVKTLEMEVERDASTAVQEVVTISSSSQDNRTDELEKFLAEIREPVLRIERTVADIYASVQDHERLEILNWVSKVGYTEDHMSINSLRNSNTGGWLSRNRKFLHWKDTDESSVLWLHGRAGAGKSILASHIISGLRRRKGDALAYFYCNEGKTGHLNPEWWRNPESVLRTLIKQLCLMGPGSRDVPKPVLDIYQQRKQNADTSRLLNIEESKDLLTKLSTGFLQMTIIIDALDECDRDTRWELFNTLEKILQEAISSENVIKILITSREYRDIRDMFGKFPNIDIRSQLQDITSDINIYINSEIETHIQRGRCKGLLLNGKINEELKNRVVSILDSKADGMFLWVRFQILKISRQSLQAGVEEVLGKLPEDLAATYTEIWESMTLRSESESDRTIIENALTWLLYAERPLSPEEFIEAISFGIVKGNLDTDTVLDLCQNLVVYDEELKVLRFTHLSVQEFLLCQSRFGLEKAHTRMAEVCLTLITTLPNEPNELPVVLMGYCNRKWPAHLRQADARNDTLQDLWRKLLNPYPPYFAWALNASSYFPGLRATKSEIISPLFVSFYFQLWDISKTLLHTGANPNCYNYSHETPLHQAARHGHIELVDILLRKYGVGVNCKSSNGRTPLSYAAEEGHEKAVQLLLEKYGVDVDSKGSSGRTPLSYAAGQGREKVVQLLLEKDGVDVDSKNSNGRTPLSYAAGQGHEKVVRLLLEKDGVDLDSKDSDGRTPLSYAAGQGREKVVQLLLEKGGVDVDSKDSDGRTPLSYAAGRAHEKVVQLLLEKGGVDVDSKDSDGRTPLSYATLMRHEKVVQLLLKKRGT